MKEKDCESYGFIERDNKVVYRDMFLKRNNSTFTISVGLPEFVNEIKLRNRLLPPHLQEDENILLLDDVSDPEKVCHDLKTLPQDVIEPYLLLQEE